VFLSWYYTSYFTLYLILSVSSFFVLYSLFVLNSFFFYIWHTHTFLIILSPTFLLFPLYFSPLNFLFYVFLNAYFFVFIILRICSNFANIFSSLVNLIRRHPNLHNPHRATYLCQFSSYHYHTSPGGPSIIPSIV